MRTISTMEKLLQKKKNGSGLQENPIESAQKNQKIFKIKKYIKFIIK